MHTSTTLTRFRRLMVVGAVVAGAIVPAAAAVDRPPDVQDTAGAALVAQLSPPDVRDAALRTQNCSSGCARALRSEPPLRDGPAVGQLRGDAARRTFGTPRPAPQSSSPTSSNGMRRRTRTAAASFSKCRFRGRPT